MILSSTEIRRSVESGEIVIDPAPETGQYTTSAVDLFLGDDFRCWEDRLFTAQGTRIELNLAEHQFSQTASSFLGQAPVEMVNHGPFHLKLVPNTTRICQLIFERIGEPPAGPIATAFQGQADPAGR